MKTINRNRLRQIIFAVLMLLTSNSLTFAYPPDNAAVLYYRASLIYDANDNLRDKLNGYVKGDISVDEEIKAYVKANGFAIKYFVDAGGSPHCDWGLDYSEGVELQMPQYAPLRTIAKIVLAKARIEAGSANYKQALDLCLGVHKAGIHCADGGLLISRLVGISFSALANQCIADILPQISNDTDMLVWLKNQIYDVSEEFTSVKASINSDLRICAQDIKKERVEYILGMAGDFIPEKQQWIIRSGDDAFFKANREYFLEYISATLAAVDLPFPQSYERLEELGEKPGMEMKKNPNAIMSAYLAPAIGRVVCLDLRSRTHFNALKTALQLYIMKARTGVLPDALSEDTPKDLFSGKDFEYEKNENGFVLRCNSKDVSKDEIYEYEFKLKK